LGWTADDVDPYLEMASHPDMSRYAGSPGDRNAVWRMF
jgi:hypothetical protein